MNKLDKDGVLRVGNKSIVIDINEKPVEYSGVIKITQNGRDYVDSILNMERFNIQRFDLPNFINELDLLSKEMFFSLEEFVVNESFYIRESLFDSKILEMLLKYGFCFRMVK